MSKKTQNLQDSLLQSRQELAASQASFRTLIQKNADGMVIVNREGYIHFANPAAEALLDYRKTGLAGQLFGYPLVTGENTEIDIIHEGKPVAIAEMRVVEIEWEGTPCYLASLRVITERKEREKQLRFLAQLLDSVREAIVATDLEGHIIYWSQKAETLYGYAQEEVIGKRLTFSIHPPSEKEKEERMRQVLEKGLWCGETLQKRKDGTLFWADTCISLVTDEDERPYGLISIDRDITHRKQIELSIEQHNRDLIQLNQASQVLSATLDLAQILTKTLEETCRLLEVKSCAIWLIDPTTGELVCQRAIGPNTESMAGRRLGVEQSLTGQVVQKGKALLVPDVETGGPDGKSTHQEIDWHFRSVLTVPLSVKKSVVGALQVLDATPNYFNSSDKMLLELFSTTVATSIENAQLYEQAQKDAKTKATLLHEVNHRVKNNLASIIGLLYAEQRLSNPNRKMNGHALTQTLINRVQGLATVHDLLSETEWNPLLLSELASQIIHHAIRALSPHHRVSIEIISSTSVRVSPKQANSLALIINELATNSIKYALPHRTSPQIIGRIVPNDDGISFEYRDNGPGYPDEVLQGHKQNMGLYLIENMVTMDLDGELELNNNGGAVTVIKFASEV